MHGLNQYDSHARMQEFQLPGFTTQDPLCEKYYDMSPYGYCGGNPVNYVDIKGDSISLSNIQNLDNRTLGWGMTFLHELHHTQVGGGLSDETYNPGDVVTQMNIIRAELNSQGGNYGQRMDYFGIPIGEYIYLPFDKPSKGFVRSGIVPVSLKHIKFKR